MEEVETVPEDAVLLGGCIWLAGVVKEVFSFARRSSTWLLFPAESYPRLALSYKYLHKSSIDVTVWGLYMSQHLQPEGLYDERHSLADHIFPMPCA